MTQLGHDVLQADPAQWRPVRRALSYLSSHGPTEVLGRIPTAKAGRLRVDLRSSVVVEDDGSGEEVR